MDKNLPQNLTFIQLCDLIADDAVFQQHTQDYESNKNKSLNDIRNNIY